MTGTLQDVIERCVCEVMLTARTHMNYHQSFAEFIEETEAARDEKFTDEFKAKAVEQNYLIELQFHPDTPVGFYCVYGLTVDDCVAEALEIFARDYPGR